MTDQDHPIHQYQQKLRFSSKHNKCQMETKMHGFCQSFQKHTPDTRIFNAVNKFAPVLMSSCTKGYHNEFKKIDDQLKVGHNKRETSKSNLCGFREIL